MRFLPFLLLATITTSAQVAISAKAKLQPRATVVSDAVAQPSIGWLAIATPPEIRPVLGFPSAARLGDALPLPAGTAAAYIAPGQTYALLTGPELLVFTLPGLDTRSLGRTLTATPVFSPKGGSVALPRNEGRIEIWTGLPQELSLAAEYTVPADASLLTLSDENTLAYTVDNHLYVSTPERALSIDVADLAFLSFVPGSTELIATLKSGGVLSLSATDAEISSRRIAESPACEVEVKGFVTRETEPVLLLACGSELTRVQLVSGSVSAHSLLSSIGSPVALANGRSAIAAGSSIQDAAEVISVRGEQTGSFLVPAIPTTAPEVQR